MLSECFVFVFACGQSLFYEIQSKNHVVCVIRSSSAQSGGPTTRIAEDRHKRKCTSGRTSSFWGFVRIAHSCVRNPLAKGACGAIFAREATVLIVGYISWWVAFVCVLVLSIEKGRRNC